MVVDARQINTFNLTAGPGDLPNLVLNHIGASKVSIPSWRSSSRPVVPACCPCDSQSACSCISFIPTQYFCQLPQPRCLQHCCTEPLQAPTARSSVKARQQPGSRGLNDHVTVLPAPSAPREWVQMCVDIETKGAAALPAWLNSDKCPLPNIQGSTGVKAHVLNSRVPLQPPDCFPQQACD